MGDEDFSNKAILFMFILLLLILFIQAPLILYKMNTVWYGEVGVERFLQYLGITGDASDHPEDAGQVYFVLLARAADSDNYKNRVFYEDGSLINLTVMLNGSATNITANFSCMDSNFVPGAETVTKLAEYRDGSDYQANYSITYTISLTNTVPNVNNSEDPTCPVGTECHRICNVSVTAISGLGSSILLPLYNGLAANNDAWYTGYVTRASNCAAQEVNSNYFLEYDTCTSVYYNPGDMSYYLGEKDVDFAIKKKNTPDLVEKLCTNGIDDDGDTYTDCDDIDCASIVYGEYYIVGGSNTQKGYTPGWTCSKTTAGWRDDPPYLPGELSSFTCVGGGSCDANCASNLCTGTLDATTVTFTYEVKPDANLSVRLEQGSGIQGVKTYFKIGNFNSSVWQNNPGDAFVLNESVSSGLDGVGQTTVAMIAQSGPYPADPLNNTKSDLDLVMKAVMDTSGYLGEFGLRLTKIFDGSSSIFKFNTNISDTGVRDEHDISCSDTYDNDLDYSDDCSDPDCDSYRGSNSANPDSSYPPCAYQNESKYAAQNNTCMDGFDNDDDNPPNGLDCRHTITGTPDLDCNNTNIINASWDSLYNVGGETGICQLGAELTCADGFDNDRDRAYDCVTEQVESYTNIEYHTTPVSPKQSYTGGDPSSSANRPDGEYDCKTYCNANGFADETGTDCYDGKDNDLDYSTGGMDCRMINYDTGCNGTTNGTLYCELIHELNCTDGQDNDRDGEYDCNAVTTGSASTNPVYQYSLSGSNTAHGEYDCQATCNVTANLENNAAKCSDNIDNDLDYWTITGWTGTQYTATNNGAAGGMDCRYNYDGNHYPDFDCDGVDMGGWVCYLGSEQNCSDGYDNDLDGATNPGGNRTTASGGYDCDDYDCNGDPACPATETGSECVDGIDNDLDRYVHNETSYLLDSDRVVNTSGGIDCIYNFGGNSPDQFWPYAIAYDGYRFDPGCNNTIIGGSGELCELIDEMNCTDVFDNDQDYYVSQIQSPGWTAAAYDAYFGASTYVDDGDCNDYSCTGKAPCPTRENYTCSYADCGTNVNWCLDAIDNDVDSYLADGFTANPAAGTGTDCAWNNYDTDCNNTLINDSGYVGVCTLLWEYNCTDNVDNDQDLGTYYLGAAGSASAGAGTGVDCDDYDCYGVQNTSSNVSRYYCTTDPEGLVILETICNDSIDNDLDAYTWNGAAYVANTSGGIDCADIDCNGYPGPGGMLCALFEEMQFDPFDDALCGDHNSSATTAYALDNDYDGPANCYDSGCYGLGICRICPSEENVTIDSCMDGLNNEFEYQDATISTMNYAPGNTNSTLYSQEGGLIDCYDPDCDGYVGLLGSTQGICSGGGLATESTCNDGYDDDFDNKIDCEDPDCSADASCLAPYSNTLAACTLKCTDAGNVDYLNDEPPIYSFNANWGGGTPDLNYTQYEHRGQNVTFHFSDIAGNVNGKTVALYLGSASETYVPLDYKLNASNSGIYGTNSGNFNVQYSAPSGAHYQAVLLEYVGAYPNDVLDITFWIQLPSTDDIVTDSSHTFYVSTNIGGVEKDADVTQYVLETEAPQAPVFIKTTPTTDTYTNDRLQKVKTDDTATRTSASDTIQLKVNASDNSGTWNSGVELCQFNIGSGWVNETSPYDCTYDVTLTDGVHTVYARVVDGVGNIGPNTSLTINVTTLPTQTSEFYCAGASCSSSYPTKDYYTNLETIDIAVNFTSPNSFTPSATGCLVYSETQTPGSRINLGNISLSASGNCNGTVSLTPLTVGYYTIKVETQDANGLPITSGEEPWNGGNSKENVWLCDYTQTFGGYTCKDACELASSTKPGKVILKSPESGNETEYRSLTFYWYNATHSENDSAPLYELQIDDDPVFGSLAYSASGITEGVDNETNHSASIIFDVDTLYYWRVRAYYGMTAGDWSDAWNFTVNSWININVTRNSVIFSEIIAGEEGNDTSDDSPLPLLVENKGNIFVNISINATDPWSSQPNPSQYYQFKMRENESNAFNTGTSIMTYTNMPAVLTAALYELNWSDASDTFQIDINITGPIGEVSGSKNSTITVVAEG